MSLFLQALLADDCELFRGPVTGEIAKLAEHLFLVVHFFRETKEFDICVCARVIPLSVDLRVVILIQFVVCVMFGVAPIVHGCDVGERFARSVPAQNSPFLMDSRDIQCESRSIRGFAEDHGDDFDS